MLFYVVRLAKQNILKNASREALGNLYCLPGGVSVRVTNRIVVLISFVIAMKIWSPSNKFFTCRDGENGHSWDDLPSIMVDLVVWWEASQYETDICSCCRDSNCCISTFMRDCHSKRCEASSSLWFANKCRICRVYILTKTEWNRFRTEWDRWMSYWIGMAQLARIIHSA